MHVLNLMWTYMHTEAVCICINAHYIYMGKSHFAVSVIRKKIYNFKMQMICPNLTCFQILFKPCWAVNCSSSGNISSPISQKKNIHSSIFNYRLLLLLLYGLYIFIIMSFQIDIIFLEEWAMLHFFLHLPMVSQNDDHIEKNKQEKLRNNF